MTDVPRKGEGGDGETRTRLRSSSEIRPPPLGRIAKASLGVALLRLLASLEFRGSSGPNPSVTGRPTIFPHI